MKKCMICLVCVGALPPAGAGIARGVERPDVSELLTRGIDPQLETALLILKAQALADTGTRHASRSRN